MFSKNIHLQQVVAYWGQYMKDFVTTKLKPWYKKCDRNSTILGDVTYGPPISKISLRIGIPVHRCQKSVRERRIEPSGS
jgi:hypothetical protein